MKVFDEELSVDFGLCDFLMRRMTFESQDFLRLLISLLGSMDNTPVNLNDVLRGLMKVMDSFASDFSGMTEEFDDLQKNVNRLSNEVSEIYNRFDLPEAGLLKGKLNLRKWEILERCAHEEFDDDVLRYAGAYYCLLLSQKKVNKNSHLYIYKMIIGEKEFLSQSAQKDLARLLSRAGKIYNANRSFEETIKGFFYYRQLFANDKQRQSVNDSHAVSSSEFLHLSRKIYAAAKDFNRDAILVATSAISGLPVHLCLQLPILDSYLHDWVMGIDVVNGVIKADLDQIFPGKAKPKENHALYKEASSVIVKPLPQFLHAVFQHLILQNKQVSTLTELLELEKVQTNSTEFNNSKFINSVARFAIHTCGIDQYEACIIANDFRSIPASKTYYRQTTRQKIWEASSVFYHKIGWGDPVSFIDGFSCGSYMVGKDETIIKIFKDLGEALEAIRPANRSNINALLNFHDHFCAYTATFAIFCLALRNANPIKILSCDYDPNNDYLLIDDKHVMGDASRQPVVITASLSKQLNYWVVHCQRLLLRLTHLKYTDKKFIRMLEGVVSQKNSSFFILSAAPYSASVAAVAKFWPLPLVENFARHFWESKFSEVGVSTRFSSVQLRHQVSGNLNWGGASDLVLTELVKKISVAQEKVLSDLSIATKHGLSRKAAS